MGQGCSFMSYHVFTTIFHYGCTLWYWINMQHVYWNFLIYTHLLGIYTFINFDKIFSHHKHNVGLKGRFRCFRLGHRGILELFVSFYPNLRWFTAICTNSRLKLPFLSRKFSYLHVYLVPKRLLISIISSHLHVYLVYTFIQYQVMVQIDL